MNTSRKQHLGATAHSRHFHRCPSPQGSHSRKWLCTALGRKHIQLIMHKCIFVGGFFYLLLFWEPAQSPWARRLSPPRPRVLWKARFLTHCRYLRSIVLVFSSGQDSSYVFLIYCNWLVSHQVLFLERSASAWCASLLKHWGPWTTCAKKYPHITKSKQL